ncbi:hypothetical protein GNP80_05490 [Aliivibrio fischeri]|uniref:hypothetical protein n=1 Tax=Aliivibrio fischeri TaxID=668 RepID=UPI0012D8D887|nr:hypothetical protein [Aliivibrio fischeri]MUK91888.1 hypothetical protein [Aliivibrio fischeri]
MKKIILSLTIAIGLTGCVQMDKNQAIVDLQLKTMNRLGLSSSDELTISEVVFSKPNAMGQEAIKYIATTSQGRVLECNTTLMPSVIGSAPTLLDPTCKPKENINYTVE